jgi:hypothetical protein
MIEKLSHALKHGMSSKKSAASTKPYSLCSNCPARIEYGQRRSCKEPSCRGALCVDCFRKSHTCDHCTASICDYKATPGNQPVDLKTNKKITEYFKKRAPVGVKPGAGGRNVRELEQPGAKRTRH